MTYKNFACALAIFSVTQAQSAAETEQYPEFAERMSLWGYGWESFEVTTEDGFILTTFRVSENFTKPDRKANSDYKPVIMVNGYECDAVSWIPNQLGETLPTALHLFDDGFDVYLMSNRGTKYCMNHEIYKDDDWAFWNFSFMEMAIYDDKANIKAVKERAGVDKVSFLGYSQGSQHAITALAQIEDEIADDLHTMMLFAPCIVSVNYVDPEVYEQGIFKFWDYAIYNLGWPLTGSPNWWDTLDFICDTFPENVCNYSSGYGYTEPVSVKGEMYGGQQHMQSRFQQYAPYYEKGETIMPLIPLQNIKRVPITMWSGLEDQTCTHQAAMDAADVIDGMVVQFNTIYGADHGIWGKPLEEPIYGNVKQQLIDPYPVEYKFEDK